MKLAAANGEPLTEYTLGKAYYEGTELRHTLSFAQAIREILQGFSLIGTVVGGSSAVGRKYHYSLLKDREFKWFYQCIRAAFKKRPRAEAFFLAN